MSGDKNTSKSVALFLVFLICLDTIAVATVIIHIVPRLVSLGANSLQAGLIAAIYGATQLFSSPIMGNIADNANRKHLLVLCILLCSFSYYFLGSSNFIAFSMSRFFTGITKHTQLLTMACLSEVVPESEKPSYFGFFGAAIGVGFIIGPIIGGFLGELPDGFGWMCTFASVVFLLNAFLVWIFLPNFKKKPRKQSSQEAEKRVPGIRGYMERLGIENCWDVLLLQSLVESPFMIYVTYFGLIMKSDYQLQPKSIGFFLAMCSFLGTLSAMIAGKVSHYSTNKGISILIGIVFLGFFGMSLKVTFITYAIISIFLNLSMGLLRSWWPNMATSRSKPEKAGSVVGAMHSVLAVVGMISPVVAGIATELFSSLHGATYLATLVSLVALISTQWFPKQISKLKST